MPRSLHFSIVVFARTAFRWWVGVVVLLVLTAGGRAAASVYPHSYSVQRHLAGVRLYPPADTAQGLFIGVKRQPFWAGEGTVLSTWESGLRLRRSTVLKGGAVMCAARPTGDTLVVVQQNGNALRLVILDTTLAVLDALPLPVERPAGAVLYRMERLAANRFLVAAGDALLLCRTDAGLSADVVATAVEEFCLLPASGGAPGGFVYAARSPRGTEVVFCDGAGSALMFTTLQTQEALQVQPVDSRAVALIEELSGSCAVTVIERSGVQTKWFLPSPSATVAVRRGGGGRYLASYLVSDRAGVHLYRSTVQRGASGYTVEQSITLPDFFVNPLRLVRIGEAEYLVFQNGLASVADDGELLSAGRMGLTIGQEQRPEVQTTAGGLALVHPSGSFLLRREEHPLWWINRLIDDFLSSFLFVLAAVVIIVLWRVQYRQRRLIRTLFEAPDAEPVLILDAEGRLERLNDTARALLHIPPDVPMRRMLHSYAADATGLQELAEETLSFRQRFSRRVEIQAGGGFHEFVFTATPVMSLFRRMRWVFITGRNITRELERKRIANWAQLAHDMQTNLSIIRLNTEKIIASPDGATERGRKILFQVNLLINRVRDLVTIGRQDRLHIEYVDAADLCATVCEEFDPSFFPNVLFRIETRTAMIACDRMKMERALRNAVENAIRALQGRDGTIELSTRTDEHSVYFQVRDTGVGMDKLTQEHMMKPFFTTFGKQGGTGMGTVIMRHVIQMHGGEMFVDSEKGRGTTVTFRLPLRGPTSLSAGSAGMDSATHLTTHSAIHSTVGNREQE